MRKYVVRQGDHLAKIAHTHGCDAETLWNHPGNAALKDARHPGILHPGDVLHLPSPPPGQSIHAGETKRFRAAPPVVRVRVRFHDGSGQPLSGKAFVVRGMGPELSDTTDGDGVAAFDVPVSVHEAEIELTETGQTHRVRVGHMDPISEPSGVWKRLRHLGYLTAHHFGPDGAYRGAVSRAVARFQTDQGIESTGVLDDATRSALADAHGS